MMNRPILLKRGIFTGIALIAAMSFGGCMSSEQKPDSLLTQAGMVVDQADRAGTRTYAAFDLNNAHSKLKKAKKEEKKGDYKKARYLAKEAKVDAELAIAKTQTAKTKEAESQLKQSMQSLQNEINTTGNTPQ